MKKGLNFYSLPKGRPYEEYLQLAKDSGFDGVELATRVEGELNLFSDEKEFTSFRAKAEKLGIELFSTISMVFGSTPLTSPDPAVRERAIELLGLQLRAARLLGADTTLVVPGVVTAEVPYDEAYSRSLESLRRAAKAAEENKVHIGVENVWNKFLLSPLEFRDFIDAIDSEYVGAYLDVGNVAYNGFPDQWARILGNRIRKVHVKDFKNGAGNASTMLGFTDLLLGDIDFPKVMAALREAGYDGYITAELSPYPLAPELLAYNTSAALDKVLGM